MRLFADYVAHHYSDPAEVLAAHFADAAAAAESVGALLDSMPTLDGSRHYLPDLKGNNGKRHYYVANLDTDKDGTAWPCITFGTFKHGSATTYWKPRDLVWQEFKAANDNAAPCPDRRAEYRRRAEEMQAKADAARAQHEAQAEQGRQAAAAAAASVWSAADTAAGHAYLTSKGVQAYGLRVSTADHRAHLWNDEDGEWQDVFIARAGELLLPMTDATGQLCNLQRIDANGRKRFLMGGRKRGTFHRIDGTAPAWMAEGYATAASVHAATGAAVVVAFDAGNLAEVARQLADQVGAVAADNDANDTGRKGAEATGLPYAMPPRVGDDWNDHAARHGLQDVVQLLASATATAPIEYAPDTTPARFDQVRDVHDMQSVAFMSWPHMSDKGQPLNTIPNLEHLLGNYGFTVRYDVIRKDLRITYPGQCGTLDNQRSKAVDTVLSLAALNRLPKSDTQSFLLSIGDNNAVNPVMDFITARPWDGRSRFAELLDTIKTRPGYDRELLELLVRRWLTSAVAAAAKPFGFWSKGVLVFQGEQSLGKTAWIRSLLPEELRDLVKIDATINPDNKDSIISAVSHWLVELGELDGTLRKADIARLKGFISQDVDQFRRPYGRVEEKFQRRTVFFASVNPEQFLADDTGNVRWWTVPVVGVNYSHGIDTQQLWAEVFSWFQAGERWWLDRNEEARLEAVNAEHQQTDPVQELIQSRYGAAPTHSITRRMTATDVLLEMGFDRPTQRQKNDAGQTLRKLFGAPKRTKSGLFFDVPVIANSCPY
ncbi:TPA: VapE domain-containing protein [Pseudomonas aeruginosa]|uniref:VapE domain-containing protein n=1 Tax=Pseudomonas aeruginosa TaxID=287 RepID=UPI00235891E4|nr:VapE domain-containing protein [Pseudomonas aeruginosa]WEO43449.1 VapE family protein [Pseudomonas aeruginosa]